MAAGMTVFYDEPGGILYIDFVPQYEEQLSDMLTDTVVARMHPETKRVESIEILAFRAPVQADGDVQVPVTPEFTVDEARVTTVEPPRP